MNYSEKTVYTFVCNETTVMVSHEEKSWEIYYRKPGYAYMFAFGLLPEEGLEEVLSIAQANIVEYEDLFE